MLRIIALVLVLANAWLLAAQFGGFGWPGESAGTPAQQEPLRLKRQLNPELVQILSPQAATAALAAAAASAAQTAAQAAAAACLEAGPFSAAEAEAAERTLRDAGLAAGSWQARQIQQTAVYMVYMGRYPDAETLQRKRDELKRRNVAAETVSDAVDWQPGLSLGRFDDKPAAEAALAGFAQRGVSSARVVTLHPSKNQTMLRLGKHDAATRARLAGLRMPTGPGFVTCPTGPDEATAPGAGKPALIPPPAGLRPLAPASAAPTANSAR